MASGNITTGTIVKLVIWSFIVGLILFNLNISPGDVYSWMGNSIASAWNWLAGSGLQYILVGATIVVPLFLISHFRARSHNRQHRQDNKGPDA